MINYLLLVSMLHKYCLFCAVLNVIGCYEVDACHVSSNVFLRVYSLKEVLKTLFHNSNCTIRLP